MYIKKFTSDCNIQKIKLKSERARKNPQIHINSIKKPSHRL